MVIPAGFAVAGTLDEVKAKGYISVGVNEGLVGFSTMKKVNGAVSMSIRHVLFLWRFSVRRIN
jgi:hypothetical protein